MVICFDRPHPLIAVPEPYTAVAQISKSRVAAPMLLDPIKRLPRGAHDRRPSLLEELLLLVLVAAVPIVGVQGLHLERQPQAAKARK